VVSEWRLEGEEKREETRRTMVNGADWRKRWMKRESKPRKKDESE